MLLHAFPGNFDTESYGIVAGIARRGGDVYRETDRYNYSPLWAHLLLGIDAAAAALGATREAVLGALLLCSDAATAWAVFLLARRRRPAAAPWAALLFFANPVSMLVSSHHLQFDGLAILLLLAAILLSDAGRDLGAAAALSVSLLVKHVTGLHPPLFRRRGGVRGWIPVVAPYAVFAASFLPYAASWRRIASNVFLYRGLTGNYGIEAIVLLPGVPEWAPLAIFAAAVIVAVLLLRRVELARASLRLFLVVLVFAPGFGRQYCVWPIALGAVFGGPGFYLYSAVSGAFLAGVLFPAARAAVPLPGWYGPFWAALAWLAWELRAVAASGAANPVKIAARPR